MTHREEADSIRRQASNAADSNRFLTLATAMFGLLLAVIVLFATGRFSRSLESAHAAAIGLLGFAAAVLAPFLIAIGAVWLLHPQAARSVVVGAALVIGLIGLATIFSGVGFLFILPAVLLIWQAGREKVWRAELRQPANATLALWTFVTLGASLAVLLLRDTPACWSGDAWFLTPTASRSSSCVTDIVDNAEGSISLALVATGITGIVILSRRMSDSIQMTSG
ncbi:MAG: hypothetical protein KF883_15765 [Thermomicrobiales bacterium]|nr:hypothetical protein [Thermomicrobiales bacterium]